MIARIPLVLAPQPEGGYTVTSPLLPELITEGDTMAEALANVEDAFAAVVEIYQDQDLSLPAGIFMDETNHPVSVEAIVSVPGDTGMPPRNWQGSDATRFPDEVAALTGNGTIPNPKKTLRFRTGVAGI